eukprot:3475730-Rhodomonas_salina.5
MHLAVSISRCAGKLTIQHTAHSVPGIWRFRNGFRGSGKLTNLRESQPSSTVASMMSIGDSIETVTRQSRVTIRRSASHTARHSGVTVRLVSTAQRVGR